MDSLTEADRRRIVEEVASLPPGGPEQWPTDRIQRLGNGEQGRYLLAVPPDYRVFLRASAEGAIFIHDVLTEEALRALTPEVVGEGAAG
jgi:hypothetical protein